MHTKTIDLENTNNVIPNDTLMEELRLIVTDAEKLLRSTANHAEEGATTARARIQERLDVVTARLIEAETPVVGRTEQAAKMTGQYIHDNHWNWH